MLGGDILEVLEQRKRIELQKVLEIEPLIKK